METQFDPPQKKVYSFKQTRGSLASRIFTILPRPQAWLAKLNNLLQVQFTAKSKTMHEIICRPYAIMYGPYLSIYGPSDDHENMHTHTLVHIDLVRPDRSCGARKWGAIRATTLCGRALSLWICLTPYIWKMNIFAKPKDMQNKAA